MDLETKVKKVGRAGGRYTWPRAVGGARGLGPEPEAQVPAPGGSGVSDLPLNSRDLGASLG